MFLVELIYSSTKLCKCSCIRNSLPTTLFTFFLIYIRLCAIDCKHFKNLLNLVLGYIIGSLGVIFKERLAFKNQAGKSANELIHSL